MKLVKDIIKSKRLELGMTMKELAEKVGVSEGTISRWESGEIANMRRNVIVSLAKALNTTPAVLMGWTEPAPNEACGIRIPVLGTVVAGLPMYASENIIDYEEITPQLAATGEYFALQIKGRSMEPRIYEGDVVIVRRQDDVDSGDTAIVLVNGDEATIKRVKKSPEGVTLIANNVAVYEPHFYSNAEIATLPVRFLGKVIELRGKL